MQYKLSLLYIVLFASVFPTLTYADDKQNNIEQLEQVDASNQILKQNGYQVTGSSIVSRADVPIIDTPATVNVVSSQLIKDRQPESLMDALYSISGVSQANTLGGALDAVQKRGFGSNRDGSILRNGLQTAESHSFGPTAETIEVLKGPASVLYGIQDPGGVINVETKKPQQDPHYIVGATVGNNNMWGTQIDFTGGLGNGFAYRFIYDKKEKDYWRNFGKIKQTTYAPSLSWENNRTKVLLAYEHLDYVEPFDRGTAFLTATGELPNIPVTRRLDEPNNETIGKTDTLQVKLEHKLNDNWKLNASYGYARSLYSYNQARLTAINLTNRTATRRIEQQNNGDNRVHAASLNLVGDFTLGQIANRFVVGLDARHDDLHIGPIYNDNSRASVSTINIDNPVYSNPAVVLKNSNNNAFQYNKVKSLGAYIQNTAYLTDNLIVSGGLRYEYYDQFAGRHGLTGTKTGYTDQHGGKLLYQLGAVYKFTPSWAVYANYAESFRPQYSRASIVSSSLAPEEGKSFETGVKFENERINASLAFFNINKRNVAESYTNSNGDAELYIAGKQRSRGIEVDINGKLFDKLSASLTYSYVDAKTLENSLIPNTVGKQLSGVPKHQAALFLAYDLGSFSFGDIRFGAGGRYLGSWYAYNSAATKSYKVPHAVVIDAFINYKTKIAGKNVNFQLNAKNLANKTYYPSTSGNATNSLIPVALGYGREIFLNTQVEF